MIGASRTNDGPAVAVATKPALGGPGRYRPTRSDKRAHRDRAVFHLSGTGMTTAEIATALRIKPRTVHKSRARIRKLAAEVLEDWRADADSARCS